MADLTTTITLANAASVFISYQFGSVVLSTSFFIGNIASRVMINNSEVLPLRHITSAGVITNGPQVPFATSNGSTIINLPSGTHVITVEYACIVPYQNQASSPNFYSRNLTVKELR
jgi:hypothetical protein